MLEEIKEKLDIVEFVKNYVELKKVGSYYRGLCPFHSEKNPSFYVSPQKQIFKCFGCNRGGDVVTFYMMIENLDFKTALKRLAEMVGVDIKPEKKEDKAIKKLLELNKIALNFFKKNLQKNIEALNYIKKRGVSEKFIDYFDLGYANIGNELRDYLFKLNYSLEDLKISGLLNDKKEDKFQNRIIFPLIDHKNRVVGFTGRLFPEREYGPKYLNSPETPLFKKSQFIYGLVYSKDYILKEKEVIVTEGQFDFILAFQNGLKNIIAISGSAFTDEQLKILKRYCNKIVFALDNDEPGFNSTLRSSLNALKNGFEVEKLEFNTKDLGEYFEKGFKKEDIKKVPLIEYLIRYYSENFDLDKIENKRMVLLSLLPLIKFYDPALKMEYVHKLSMVLNINENFILEELEKTKIEKIEEEERIEPILQDRFKILLERYSAISLVLDKEKNLVSIKEFLDDEEKGYIEKIINGIDDNDVEIVRLRSLYEKSLNINLDEELIFLEREIAKEFYKRKIKFLKDLLKFRENQNIDNVLKEVKIYIEKLRKIEKNA
ncbi:MAG: DNA primase [Minisyncoccia bacterium]